MMIKLSNILSLATDPVLIILIVFLSILVVGGSLFAVFGIIRSKYRNYIIRNSEALRRLKEINPRYKFKHIRKYDWTHTYDNRHFFNDISCEDYLIYEIAHAQKGIISDINKASYNKELFKEYKDEVNRECTIGRYSPEPPLKNEERLHKYETAILEKEIQAPIIVIAIKITLFYRKMNGSSVAYKSKVFYEEEILSIIRRVNNKEGTYYLDDKIWQSICRIERGRVSNKMRFAIYNRDNNRCVRCGSRYDLEIDHIIPISKGGKTTYNNLQTLCHRCNVKKGDSLDW